MGGVADWPSFYRALCAHGSQALTGLSDADRELVDMVASSEDTFWSDGLQAAFEDAAAAGDVRAGVLAALGVWRDTVLSRLSSDFGVDLDRGAVRVAPESAAVARLVVAGGGTLGGASH